MNRLRPKLMTAASAMLGLLPLVLLPGAGADIERPLAMVMIGGLVTSTVFTLLVLPVAYEVMEQAKSAIRGGRRAESLALRTNGYTTTILKTHEEELL